MYPEFKKFVNLIGHDITISGHATLPRAEHPCRVETEQMIIGKLAGVPIVKQNLLSLLTYQNLKMELIIL